MFTAVVIFHVIVSIFLVVVVLLQAGKGAEMGAAFGGSSSQTLFGSAGPATFLGKLTAACAALFLITSLALTYLSAHRATGSIMKDVAPVKKEAQQVPQEQTAPAAAQAPAPESTPDKQ